MKKRILSLFMFISLSLFVSSCYTYTFTVGDGPQTGVEVTKKNHYLINGLAPVGLSESEDMIGDATDYEVTITHTFVDGLVSVLTFGIYSPTTTIVKK